MDEAVGAVAIAANTGGRRRESLLSALMNVATGNSSASLTEPSGASAAPASEQGHALCEPARTGVCVRAFKMDPTGRGGSELRTGSLRCPSASFAARQQRQQVADERDNKSAETSAQRTSASPAARTDFVELGLVELAGGGGGECSSIEFNASLGRCDGGGADDGRRGAPSDAFKITCRRSEFPLRLTLYQCNGAIGQSTAADAEQRNGAVGHSPPPPLGPLTRYTLGHCVIEPRDWLARTRAATPPRNATRKCSILGRQAAAGPQQVGGRKSARARQVTLEYRLHATLLEAIKSA